MMQTSPWTLPSSAARAHRPRLTLVPSAGSASGTIRVAIAVRQPLVRAGLRALLDRDERITVIGEAATGEEALSLAGQIGRGVVLLDPSLPGLDCVQATRRALAEPEAAVLLLIASEIDDRIRAALLAGAGGVVLDDAEPDALIRAVEAMVGRAGLPPRRSARHAFESSPRREHRRPKVTELRLASAHGNLVAPQPIASPARREGPTQVRDLPETA
jgi:DNA-binding NarL/FixJ family response regulator